MFSLRKKHAKAVATSPPEPELRELPLNHSIRNGWTAKAVYYKDKSEDALMRFEEDKSGQAVFTVLRTPWGDLARFDADDKTPALQNAPLMSVDFTATLASVAIHGDKLDRYSRQKACAAVARMK